MENKEEIFNGIKSKEMKLKGASSISVIALGLGLQASIKPPSPIPFLQNSSIAYLVLGLGVIGMAISSVLIMSVLREKIALSKNNENS